jgi:spore coat polysaccharide biosynthesis protein SpsF
MKRVLIVQARTGSTRLPGKVLLNLEGWPMLAQQLRRLKLCCLVDEIVVATTSARNDDAIVELADKEGVRWFRGSEEDVLSRYLGAASESHADIVVRVTADCPLIDPQQTDRIIKELETHGQAYDYVSNCIKRTFPRGMDAEAMFRDVLERIGRLATSRPAREHVTHFLLQEKPELFVRGSVTDYEDNSDLRWTVDTPQDFESVRQIFQELNLSERTLEYREVLAFVRAHPELSAINANAQQRHA